ALDRDAGDERLGGSCSYAPRSHLEGAVGQISEEFDVIFACAELGGRRDGSRPASQGSVRSDRRPKWRSGSPRVALDGWFAFRPLLTLRPPGASQRGRCRRAEFHRGGRTFLQLLRADAVLRQVDRGVAGATECNEEGERGDDVRVGELEAEASHENPS